MREARIVGPLSGGSWRRIVIVAAAVSALVGGAVSLATRAVGTEPATASRDRLFIDEEAGCVEMRALPKRGWVCTVERPHGTAILTGS